ncbi:MAG: TSUP family transporter, partial [bacterium]
MLKIIILFFTGVIAGFINVNAGGGSSLTLPVMIFLGLDSSVANGTNRIGILVQTFSSVSSFRKQKYSDFRTSFILACFALPG